MRYASCVISIAVFHGAALAAHFEATEHGYVLKEGDEYIRFDKGKWTAGIEGAGSVRWHMFLWHDDWVYETLPGGTIQAGPTLNDDGSITSGGTFSAGKESAAMQYACRITPRAEGLRVRCEMEKTGPFKLTNGLWLHVRLCRDHARSAGPGQVWIAPSWHGRVGSTAKSTGERFLIELAGRRSLCLGADGFGEIASEGSPESHTYRFNLLRGDFEPGRKVSVEYTISFADMPESFPGDITPMRKPLRIAEVSANSTKVPQYERLELSIKLDASYDNPYDPHDVRLDAVFTQPSGKRCVVPGFFMVPYRRKISDQAEVMVPEGKGLWKVRFAPSQTGRHTWSLRVRDRRGQVSGGEGTFEATSGSRPGFVRRSTADPHYLAFDNGEGYFAIGHNLPIYHTSGQLGDQAMRKFAAAGENYNRWWMSSRGLGIEWMDKLGWYRQDVAARIDLVLDVARELNLYYMMCMDTHQDFRESGWKRNPFNAINGGPCKTPADWFVDERARTLYRNRLRYTVARWGCSSNVLCWEFGNEFEGWADSPNRIKLPWHREMAGYLRSIDPFKHLITTSFWSKTGPEEFWELENIDIVQTHCYTNDDANVAAPVRRYCLHQWERFDKPHIFGEFGIRSHSTTADKDPQGWAIHNALWASLLSFSAGGAMPWWHETYIDKLDLYFHFTALAGFANGLPLGTARWEPLETTTPEFSRADHQPEVRDAVLPTLNRWDKPEHAEFTILRDGSSDDDRLPQRLLHGAGHKDLKNPPEFVVDYPRPGKFVVRVDRVSNSGLLRICLDGQEKLQRELPCGEGLGKKSVWRPQWKLWETVYDQDIALDVPAGRHRIRVENFGKDWVAVTRYTFTACKLLDKPNVLVCGMKTEGLAIVWIENKDSSWYNHAAGGKLRQVDAFTLTVSGLADGKYQLEWWDTWKGKPTGSNEVEVASGRLKLSIGDLKTDVAVKIKAL